MLRAGRLKCLDLMLHENLSREEKINKTLGSQFRAVKYVGGGENPKSEAH